MDEMVKTAVQEWRQDRRRGAFWRGVLAALFLAALVVAGVMVLSGDGRPRGAHIARVEISGSIRNDLARDDFLAEIEAAEDVRALIVHIDSGGGTSVGGEALHDALRRIAETRPVVAVMGETAASGGYVAAIAADHVVARATTLTGAIGVIMEYPDFSGLMDRLGVGMTVVRSSEIKGEPSLFRPTPPAVRPMQDAIIADGQDWLTGLVSDRRGLTGAALSAVTDGRVFTGRDALELGLVDAIGGEPEALAYLETIDPELGDLPVEPWLRAAPDIPAGLLGQMSSTLLAQAARLAASETGPRLGAVAR